MRKTTTSAAAAILMGAAFYFTPVMAKSTTDSPTLNRIDQGARTTIGAIYGAVGNEMCGKPCSAIGKRVGPAIYDGAQTVSERGAVKLQDIGRRGREYFTGRGR